MRLRIEPANPLIRRDPGVSKEDIKGAVAELLKERVLIVASESSLQFEFQPDDGCDILVKKIDPEEALGYQRHSSESDYFRSLSGGQADALAQEEFNSV